VIKISNIASMLIMNDKDLCEARFMATGSATPENVLAAPREKEPNR
jgi:hypothetical protein